MNSLLTRLGRKIATAVEKLQGDEGWGCCTCGEEDPNGVYFEYQDACSNQGYWDWAQCQSCHNGTDEHAVWMRSLNHRPRAMVTR